MGYTYLDSYRGVRAVKSLEVAERSAKYNGKVLPVPAGYSCESGCLLAPDGEELFIDVDVENVEKTLVFKGGNQNNYHDGMKVNFKDYPAVVELVNNLLAVDAAE